MIEGYSSHTLFVQFVNGKINFSKFPQEFLFVEICARVVTGVWLLLMGLYSDIMTMRVDTE